MTTATAETRSIVNVVRLSATVVVPRRARVSVAVGGLVERLAVGLGDHVEKGDLLVELDRALITRQVEQAEAALAEAEARLEDARRQLRIGRRLVKKRNIPQNEVDNREAAVSIAEAALKRLEAEAAAERVRLDRHRITAPFAGVVSHKTAEAGEWVSPGTAVVELVASDRPVVDVPVPQIHYPRLLAGAPVSLRFDAVPGREVATEQVALVPVSDPTDRTFTLRVRPKDRDLPLTPGMSARALIRIDQDEKGVVVPRDAVIRYPDGRTTVWVLKPAEGGGHPTVSEMRVPLGIAFDGLVHVKEGLDAGATVITRGNESLREGQTVRVTGGAGAG